MEKLRYYIRESYDELVNKVTWPSWQDLFENSKVVIVATIIFAVVIFIMDAASNGAMGVIYGLK